MTIVSVVFQSGSGHTKVLAEALVKGLMGTEGIVAQTHEIHVENVNKGRFGLPWK